MNTYIIKCFSLRLLNDEINKIIQNTSNVIRLNFDGISLNDLIEECSYFSLLNEEKIVIVNNFKLNTTTKGIDSYLNNPNPNTKLILIVDNIDKRNSTYKLVKEKGTVIEITDLKVNEISNKISIYCKNAGIKIDYLTLSKLLDNNLNNYDLALSEIDKISLITNNITSEVLNDYGAFIIQSENFALCDAITNKDYSKIKDLLSDFISTKSEVIPFVALLASQYRIMYAAKCMSGSPEVVGQKLNIHPYRVKLAKEKAINYTKEDILSNLEALCNLDYQLKSSGIDPYTLLKIFLINI